MKWLRKQSDGDPKTGHVLLERLYTLGESVGAYPRLAIAIYPEYPGDPKGIKISCSQKDGKDDWWTATEIPVELLDDLIEMLVECKGAK